MASIRVIPDGSLIDRVAEYSFADLDTISTLFPVDTFGYADAIAKFVQALAMSEVILGAQGNAAIPETETLKEMLRNRGLFEYSDFYKKINEAAVGAGAYEWLDQVWPNICEELKVPNSPVEVALSGMLLREYHRKRIDSKFNTPWYLPTDRSFHLPDPVLSRFVRKLVETSRNHWPVVEEGVRAEQIEQVVTAHYVNFGKYWLHFQGADQYLPAASRSHLSFLTVPSQDTAVESYIAPFLALAAIKKVKKREGLIDGVLEWRSREGREVVEGVKFLHLAHLGATPRDEKLIANVKSILESSWSEEELITMNLVSIGLAMSHRSIDTAALQTLRGLALDRSYRCLWRIREPRVREEWHQRVRELLHS